MILGGPFGLYFLWPVLFAGLVFLVLLVVVVLVLRSDRPDRHGRRPVAVYLFSTIFVSLFVTLAGIAGIAAAAGGAIGDSTTECATLTSLVAAREGQVEPSPFPLPTVEPVPPGFRPPDFGEAPEPVFPSAFPLPDDFAPILPTVEPEPPVTECPPAGDFATGLAIRMGLLAVAGGAVLFFHVDRARELLAKEASDG